MKTADFFTVLKGGLIGASMLIPGVSGGTAAIILGIYDDILSAISCFTQDKKKHFLFLLKVGIGGVIGICLFARLLLQAVTAFPMPMMFLFLGAIGGSIPALIKKSGIHSYKISDLLFFLIGLAVVFGLSYLPQLEWNFAETDGWGFLILLLAGFGVAIALILPGISASYILFLLGIYEVTLSAIRRLDFLFLAPLGIGILVGVLLTARLLEKGMQKFPRISYLTISGFVAGSMLEVFPGFPSGIMIPISIMTMAIGFLTVFFLGRSNGIYFKGFRKK